METGEGPPNCFDGAKAFRKNTLVWVKSFGFRKHIVEVGLGHFGTKMFNHILVGQAEFTATNDIVEDSVFQKQAIGNTLGSAEPVQPSHPGDTHRLAAELADLGMYIPLLTPEASE